MECSEIQRLQNDTGEWSDSVFGANRSPLAPLHHLKDEVEETISCPRDVMEYADCLILLIDAFRMAGGTADNLVEAAFIKLEINKNRIWGEPDINGVVHHIITQTE